MSTHRRRRGSVKKVLIILALVVVSLCAIVWGVLWWLGRSYQLELEEGLAQIRARGEPVTLDDLTPGPVPQEENAALVYRLAYDVFVEAHEEVKESISIPWRQKTPEQWLAVREWVAENQQALRLVGEAAGMGRCQFLGRYTGFSQELPHLSHLRNFSFLLGESARLHLAEGDVQAAFDDCLVLLRLAEHLGQGRYFVHALVQTALISITGEVLQEVLSSSEAGSLDLAPLARSVAGLRDSADFRHVLIGERAMALHLIDHHWAEEAGAGLGRAMEGSPLAEVWIRREKLAIIEGYEKLLDLAAKPWYESRADREEFESWVEETATSKWPLPRLFVALLMPGTPGALSAPPTREAYLSQIALGVESELHRRRMGSFPDSLNDLTLTHLREVLMDPFSGRPFLYERVSSGYVLYSVGSDAKDDGGMPVRRGRQQPGDIVWSVNVEPEE